MVKTSFTVVKTAFKRSSTRKVNAEITTNPTHASKSPPRIVKLAKEELKRGPKRMQTDYFTLRDMSKSSNSDSHKCNIVCSMLTEGEINIILSA